MRKLIQCSLSVILVVMMVITMFSASFAVADTGEVVMRSMDYLRGYSGVTNIPPSMESGNYMEGTGAFKYDLSGRDFTDLFFYGADGPFAELNTVTDISSAIDANGKTVWAFDLYVSDAEKFKGTGTMFSLMCQTDDADSQNVNSMNAWVEIDTTKNALWTEDFGLENGLQDGWNHIAITIDTDEGENKYAHASNSRANYWNPNKLWKFRIKMNHTAADEQIMIIDDVRFMTPANYASAAYTSELKAKKVMALIYNIKDANDTEGLAAVASAYGALTDAEKAMVLNYSKYESYSAAPMSVQLHACDDASNAVAAAGFSKWTKTSVAGKKTEGAYSLRGTSPEGTVSIHFAFQSTEGWDFSNAEYLVFDFFYHGLSFNWVNGANDQNIGIGPTTTWSDMGYGNITNGAMQTHMMSKLVPDQWNHVVIPLDAFNLTSEQLVHNLRFYWEGCVSTIAGKNVNQFWIDDIRIVNTNGLATLVPEANAGKDLALEISGLTIDNTQGIADAKAAYDALSDTAKAAVYNASTLVDLEEAAIAAPAFDAKVKALINTEITYADKAEIEALRAEYTAFSETAKGAVTALADLEAMEAVIAAEMEKAAAVEAAITALPAEIDLSHKGAVEAARASYDALANDTKAGVTNLAVLESAEAKIAELEQAAGDAEKAAAVDAAIATLKDADSITVEDEAAIAAAEAMYNSLTDAQKELVKAESLEKLAAVKASAAQDKADREAAAAVDAAIAALPETIVVTDKDAVTVARTAYNGLNDKAKSYVTQLAVLEAAEETIAVMEKNIADAKVVEEKIAALPETVTAENADDVEVILAAYKALSAEAKGLVQNINVLNAAEVVIASLGAYDTPFRAFELADADLNQANNYTSGGLCKEGLVDKRAFQVVWDGSVSTADMHLYVYGYNQNNQNDSALFNPDGRSQLIVTNPEDMYITFDMYVSDASVLTDSTGDCGLGLDTVQTGGANAWGNAGTTKNTFVRPALQGLVDGWNHVVIPLTLSGAYMEGDGSKRPIKAGDVLTVAGLRLYCTGLTIPAEGFTVRIDDMRFMNGAGVAEINSLRNIAKDVTLAIQNYPAEASYNDFYAIYAKYMALTEEYQTITKGWDEFATANASFVEQADEQFPADKATAAAVDALIALFANGVDLDDKAAVEAARKAYGDLTDIQKNMVLKAEILVAAEKSIAEQEETRANQEAAAAVDALINALPSAKDMTIGDKAAVEAARAAYTNLTDVQKKLVKGLMTLRSAETAIIQIERLIADAQPVVDMIAALPATADITVDDAVVVEAARDAYDDLDEETQAYVTNLAVLEAAEKAVADAIALANDKEVAAAAEALINALCTPTDVAADDKEAIDAAKAAYDALTDAQKAFLGEGVAEKLTACVDALDKVLSIKMGDINNDGKIDAKDALIALKIAVDKYTATDAEKAAADVNEDQKVDAKDALEMLKYAVKKPSALDKFYQEA